MHAMHFCANGRPFCTSPSPVVASASLLRPIPPPVPFSCLLLFPARPLQVVMEIPLPMVLSITREHPWMFHPDVIPLTHPIRRVIEATHPEVLRGSGPDATRCALHSSTPGIMRCARHDEGVWLIPECGCVNESHWQQERAGYPKQGLDGVPDACIGGHGVILWCITF